MIVSETWQTINDHFVSFLGAIFFLFLIIHIYSNNKIVSVIIVIKTPAPNKKEIKLFRNSSIEIKLEIVANLLRPKLYNDKTN